MYQQASRRMYQWAARRESMSHFRGLSLSLSLAAEYYIDNRNCLPQVFAMDGEDVSLETPAKKKNETAKIPADTKVCDDKISRNLNFFM